MLLDVNLDLMIINEVEMVKSLITYIIYRLINMFGATMFGSPFLFYGFQENYVQNEIRDKFIVKVHTLEYVIYIKLPHQFLT